MRLDIQVLYSVYHIMAEHPDKQYRCQDLLPLVQVDCGLSAEQMAERTKGGKNYRVQKNVEYALSNLNRAGLIEKRDGLNQYKSPRALEMTPEELQKEVDAYKKRKKELDKESREEEDVKGKVEVKGKTEEERKTEEEGQSTEYLETSSNRYRIEAMPNLTSQDDEDARDLLNQITAKYKGSLTNEIVSLMEQCVKITKDKYLLDEQYNLVVGRRKGDDPKGPTEEKIVKQRKIDDELELKASGRTRRNKKNVHAILIQKNKRERIYCDFARSYLTMTLYIFLLKHPEGVRLADFSKHETELEHIYGRFSSDNISNQKKSLKTLSDPSRISQYTRDIKKTFKSVFSKEVAEKYCVRITEDGRYVIDFDRKRVIWEEFGANE